MGNINGLDLDDNDDEDGNVGSQDICNLAVSEYETMLCFSKHTTTNRNHPDG
jgi:hypothetical protein